MLNSHSKTQPGMTVVVFAVSIFVFAFCSSSEYLAVFLNYCSIAAQERTSI